MKYKNSVINCKQCAWYPGVNLNLGVILEIYGIYLSLQYLTELTVLNLNCNKISKIPCLSVTCKARIQVLLLKYNQLSHLDGKNS